ncbi:hypothetical protein FKG94_24490 [Exilibacterium tricleocarpae]|uniref:Uncharacterized protein n=1 Tax=Exilibacterium tricleocarpae TaxID=2591008 RepID=A0A545SSS4_9GAMM|nr:hypothetical protein [Exilibacterium tricleocarpae]TQV67996.1 hypothetical protein FKG94_24490 [Exilibacterium tricleocarpae]
MDQDPYKPPTSDLDKGDPGRSNSFWWKFYCWFNASAMLIAMIALPQLEGQTLLDTLDVAVSVVATVGLFGFAYYKPIYTMVFWRYFFYVALLETLLYSVLLPALGVKRYGEVSALDGYYLFELGYATLMLSALNMYAYKRPFIWRRAA